MALCSLSYSHIKQHVISVYMVTRLRRILYRARQSSDSIDTDACLGEALHQIHILMLTTSQKLRCIPVFC